MADSILQDIQNRRRTDVAQGLAGLGELAEPEPGERGAFLTQRLAFGAERSPANPAQRLAARTWLQELQKVGVVQPDADLAPLESKLTVGGHNAIKTLYETTIAGRAKTEGAEASGVRADAAMVRAKAGPAVKPAPQWADMVAKEVKQIQQHVNARKEKGLPMAGVGPEDIQLQAVLNAGLTFQNDARFPEARDVGRLAAALEPYRNNPEEYLAKFSTIYAAAKAKPPEVQAKNAAFYSVLERMRGRIQGPSWFGMIGAGLPAPVPSNE